MLRVDELTVSGAEKKLIERLRSLMPPSGHGNISVQLVVEFHQNRPTMFTLQHQVTLQEERLR